MRVFPASRASAPARCRDREPPGIRFVELYLEFHGCATSNLVSLVSCGQCGVQFVQQWEQVIPEQLVGFAQATALRKRSVIEIVRLDAQAGGDVVTDEIEPGALVGSEGSRTMWPRLRQGCGAVGLGRDAGDLFLILEP